MPGRRKHLSQHSRLLPALGSPPVSFRGEKESVSSLALPLAVAPALAAVFQRRRWTSCMAPNFGPSEVWETYSTQHRLRTSACASLQHTRRQAEAHKQGRSTLPAQVLDTLAVPVPLQGVWGSNCQVQVVPDLVSS